MTAYPKLVMRSETSCFADLSSPDANSTRRPFPSVGPFSKFAMVSELKVFTTLAPLRLTGDDDARTSPAKVGELERIPSYGRRRRSRCAESEAQSERYPWSVLTHSMMDAVKRNSRHRQQCVNENSAS